jgi:hypothetical protein
MMLTSPAQCRDPARDRLQGCDRAGRGELDRAKRGTAAITRRPSLDLASIASGVRAMLAGPLISKLLN